MVECNQYNRWPSVAEGSYRPFRRYTPATGRLFISVEYSRPGPEDMGISDEDVEQRM